MKISRKRFGLGLTLAATFATMVASHTEAQAQKEKYVSSGPPTISMVAEPTVVKACPDAARVQLTKGANTWRSGLITGIRGRDGWCPAELRAKGYRADITALEHAGTRWIDKVRLESWGTE